MRVIKAVAVVTFVFAASAVGLKIWITHLIEAAAVQTAICISPQIEAKLSAGKMPAGERDVLVVGAAEFAGAEPSPPGLGWVLRGTAIKVGYKLLWSERNRAANFDGLYPHLRACPRAYQSV